MDDYLFTMFLAEKIMKSVFKNRDIEWEPQNSIRPAYKGKLPDRIVVLSLTKAVLALINSETIRIKSILRDYTENNAPTVNEFCLYFIEYGSEVFKEGFKPNDFITYSAIVAEMAYKLYDHCQDIPEYAVGVIGTVLTSQIMTGQFEDSGGQEGLKIASFKLLNKQRNLGIRETSI